MEDGQKNTTWDFFLKIFNPLLKIYIGVTYGLIAIYLLAVYFDGWSDPRNVFLIQWIIIFYPAVVIIILKIMKEKISTDKIKADSLLKISSFIGIIIIAFSLAYYFVIRPMQKQDTMKKCNEETEALVGWNSSNKLKMDKFKDEYDRCLRKNGL
jgi:hypothetical protein